MSEKIGLEAVFDLGQWDQGISRYISRTKEAEGATDKAAGSLAKGWDSMGKSVLNATNLMGKALVGATAAAAAAVGAFVVGGIKGAADLEAQLSTIASVLGVTTEAVGPLKEAVYDLALNPNLKVGVDEAALAMENLARNGLDMTQILGGAAEATVLLANATKADFGLSADIATDAMAIFNIEAKDMMQAVNGIVSVTNVSKFGIEDYALALAQGGGVASAVGVEFADFNSTVAAISPLFASGSDAGTSLKTMLQRLIPQSSAAAEAMGDIGLTTVGTQSALEYLADKGVKPVSGDMWELFNQVVGVYYAANDLEMGSEKAAEKFNKWATETGLLQSAFFDQNGQMKDMNDIAAILNGALGGLSEMEKNAALSTIFGTDAMRAAVALADSGQVVYTDLAKASEELGISQDQLRQYIEGGITAYEVLQARMAGTDALQNAKTNTDNFQSALSMLTDTIDAVGRRVGDLFLPMLKDLALSLNDMAGTVGPIVIDAFENMFKVVQDFQAGLVGFNYDWNVVFPPTLAAIASGIAVTVGFVAENFDAFAGAVGGVAALLAASALPQVLAGIGAAIAAINLPLVALIAAAALAGAAWNANWFGIRDTTFAVIEAIQGAFAPVFAVFAQFGSDLLALVGVVAQFGQEAIGEITAFIQGTGTEFSALNIIWDAASSAFSAFFAGIGPAAASALTAITTWVGDIVTSLLSSYPSFAATMLGYSTALVNWIGEAAALGITALGDWVAGIITWLAGDGQSQIATSTGPLIDALIDWIANDLIPQVGPAMALFGLALGGAILTIAQALGTAALAIGGAIVNAILGTDWATTGGQILTLLQTGFEAAKDAIITAALGVGNLIRLAFEIIDWDGVGKSILDTLRQGVDAGKTLLITAATTVATAIQTAFEGVDWNAVGKAILDKLKLGFDAGKSALTTAAAAVGTWIKEKFEGVDWNGVGKAILDKLKLGFDAGKEALTTAATAVATAVKDYFGEEKQSWTEVGKVILDKIKSGFEAAKETLLTVASNIGGFIKEKFDAIDWKEVGMSILRLIGAGIGAQVAVFLLAVGGVVELVKLAWNIDWKAVGQGILDGIKAGYEAVKAVFLTTIGAVATDTGAKFTAIDWKAVGQGILDGIKAGYEAIKVGFLIGVGAVAGDTLGKFTAIDWKAYGQGILDGIKAGIDAAKTAFLQKVGEFAQEIYDKFANINWSEIGKAILDGIGQGITDAKDALKQKAEDIADSLPDWMKDVLGISSPSRVFAEIGRNIVEGLIAGIDQKLGDLDRAMGKITRTILDVNFAQGGFDTAIAGFKEYAGVVKGLTELGADGKLLEDFLDKQTKDLDTRKRILDLLASLRIDPRTFGGDFLAIPIDRLFQGIQQAANKTVAAVRTALQSMADRLPRQYALDALLEKLIPQESQLAALAKQVFSGFFERATDEIDRQISALDSEIAAAQAAYLSSGLERDLLAVEKLISDRAALVAQLTSIAARGDFMTRMYGDTAAITAALNEQLDLIRQAKAAGVGLGDMGILSSAMTQEELLRLGDIQAQVARKQAEALRKEIAGELYLRELGTGLEDLTGAAATYKSRFIDPLVTRLRESVLIESTRNELLEEYRKRAQEALKLQTQQNRLEQIAVQLSGQLPAAAQYYKEQVLDPILTRLREQVLLEEERNRLTTQYQAGAQKLLQIQRQQAQLDFLNQQLDLIKQVNDEGLDPSKIFAGITLGWDATAEGLATAAGRVVDALILNVSGEIGRALQVVARNEEELARQMELGKLLAGFNAQNNTIKSVAGNFFSSFFQTAETKIRAGIAKIDEQLTTLRGQFLRTGDALFGDRIKALISQRQTLVSDLRNLGDQDYFLKYFAGGDPSEIQGVLSDQLKLIQDAKRLGVSLGKMQPLAKDFSIADLTNLGILEGMVANKQTEELRRQIAEALFIGDLGNAGNGLTGPAAIYKTKVLDPIMAQLRASVLNEAERVRLIAKYNEEARKAQAIQAQQNLVDKLAAQLGGNLPALGQRYQTQVLDPILAKLREQVLTEAERNRLSEEYRKGQEKLLQLQREQSKLDFLKEQLDLIKLVKDNELDASWVFQGLTLGINASISDLLAATTRAVQAMIAQVQGDLKIASPSKVFVDIGKQVMAGLARGIDSNVVRPMSSLQRAIEVPRGSVSNRSLNLSFGGVTISNGTDLATFETRVQRIIESSLA